ncbi:hypothetical protein G9A89_020112 [Geosiphon pyriformis]|nr:hypothetical protein G9A89_020112 [Geosiphon pyriformis]
MAKSLIQNVTEDHLVIKTLYAMFRDEDNTVQRQKIANTIIRELTVHSVTEEIVLYCSVDKYIPDRKMIVGEAREEHFAIQNEIFQLDNMKVTDPNYGEKLDNTIRKFNKHACQEEVNILPKLKETLSVEQMNKLARQWEKDRALVPTRKLCHKKLKFKIIINAFKLHNLTSKASVATNPFDQARDINREYVEIDRNNL